MGAGLGSIIGAAASVVGTMMSQQTAKASLKAQERAQAQSQAQAQAQAELQKQEINRANAKTPDMGSMMDKAQAASKMGAQGTLLTGNQGVNDDDLSLGGSGLLGF